MQLALLKYLLAALGLAAVFAYGFGRSYVTDYRDAVEKATRLERQLSLAESREASLRGMIDRREQAINYSQCKDKIWYWIRNPEKMPSPIPKPFSIPGQD